LGAGSLARLGPRWLLACGGLVGDPDGRASADPGGEPVRARGGGDFRGWTVFGLLAAVVLGYREVLRAVHGGGRPSEPAPATTSGTFREAELDRYARHIILREIGGPGQKRLKAAKVLVVGAGGLGSPVLLYLAAAGVGTIGVIDDDVVEGSNLQRQVIHTDGRIGMPKVFSAEVAMRALNPFIEVRPYHRKLTEEIAGDLVRDYDLVLDGTDDFDTRYLVNRACVAAGVPLISGRSRSGRGRCRCSIPRRGALLCLRLPGEARPGSGADLCRGGGGGALAGGHRVHDGDGGGEVGHRGRGGAGGAADDPRRALYGDPGDRGEEAGGLRGLRGAALSVSTVDKVWK
jgi:molybdopterin/thiamine biosynthesis adenylyltransferase